jgi:hypothetical protein
VIPTLCPCCLLPITPAAYERLKARVALLEDQPGLDRLELNVIRRTVARYELMARVEAETADPIPAEELT